MKRKIALLAMAAMMVASLTACGSGGGTSDGGSSSGSSSDVANADKPLVWFNRQPSNSSTGELDMTALNFNDEQSFREQ